MISWPVRVSRLPVGSSARMTRGPFDRARAMRDALLLAARQLLGQVVGAVSESDAGEEAQRAFFAAAARSAERRERGLDVLERGQRRHEVELLEHEPEGAQPQVGELVVGQRS